MMKYGVSTFALAEEMCLKGSHLLREFLRRFKLNADGEHHEEALSNPSDKAKENKDHQAIEDLHIVSFGNILQGSWIVES